MDEREQFFEAIRKAEAKRATEAVRLNKKAEREAVAAERAARMEAERAAERAKQVEGHRQGMMAITTTFVEQALASRIKPDRFTRVLSPEEKTPLFYRVFEHGSRINTDQGWRVPGTEITRHFEPLITPGCFAADSFWVTKKGLVCIETRVPDSSSQPSYAGRDGEGYTISTLTLEDVVDRNGDCPFVDALTEPLAHYIANNRRA